MAATDWESELTLVNDAIAANLSRLGASTLTDRGRQLVQQSLDELSRHRERVQAEIDRAAAGSSGMIVRGIAQKQT